MCDLLVKKAEEREEKTFRSSNLLIINTETTRSVQEEQCFYETMTYFDNSTGKKVSMNESKASGKEADVNENEPVSTSTPTTPNSPQNNKNQSRNRLDGNVTDATQSIKVDPLESKIESVKTETSQSEVLKSAEDTCQTDEGMPQSERKTDGEKNDDPTSITQIERCEPDVEDGEIVESTPEEDKINSNDLAEGNKKKECNINEHESVKNLYLCYSKCIVFFFSTKKEHVKILHWFDFRDT